VRAAKDELRQRMRDLRYALTSDEVARRSALAAPHVLALPEVAAARRVALFAAVRKEIDTAPIHDALRARGVETLYPRVEGGGLAFAGVAERAELLAGPLGIPAPPTAAPSAAATEIDVFVIPGLAFDELGERLGWGRGHYDRALASAPRALRVGYAYDFQVVPVVPVGADDARMDVVVTCRGSRRIATERPR
jgi:5-formyltetrahydrofolate cyclo-ligase